MDSTDSLETILRLCAAAAPKPWYPKKYAAEAGVPRDSLDAPLERLRLGRFVELTEWVEGLGQGYVLTPAGRRAVQDARNLERLHFALPLPPDRAPPSLRPRVGNAAIYERGETIRDALLNPSTSWVTYTLLAANILWYLYGMRLAQAQGMDPATFIASNTPTAVLHKTGGIHGSYLVSGHWWEWGRLLLCCFVHGSLLHLGMNMLGLYWVGPLIERMWGHVRFLAIYLIAGLGGSCAMVIKNPEILGVGASGAIWGIMTSMAVWIILNRKFMPPSLVSDWLRQLLYLFLLNLGIGFIPGISMSAHLGGGALGAIAAVLLNTHRFGRGIGRWLALVAVLALPLLCVEAVARAIEVDDRWAVARAQQEARKALEQDLREKQEFSVKREKEVRESKEWKAVDNQYQSAHKSSVRAIAQAWELFKEDPDQRDKAKVTQVIADLSKARAELVGSADAIASAPADDPETVEGRKILGEYLRKRGELCDLTASDLREKRTLAGDVEKAWRELNEECARLRQRWEQLP